MSLFVWINWYSLFTPIPKITQINDFGFSGCTNLNTILFSLADPPNLGWRTFVSQGEDKIWNIIVPEASRQKYVETFNYDPDTFDGTKRPTINGTAMPLIP